MPKITITFQEEGGNPTQVEIPEDVVAALEAHVQYLQEAGVPVQDKTSMFVYMTWTHWLKPALERQGMGVHVLAGEAGVVVQQAEAALAQAKKAAELAAMQNVIRQVISE